MRPKINTTTVLVTVTHPAGMDEGSVVAMVNDMISIAEEDAADTLRNEDYDEGEMENAREVFASSFSVELA